MGQESSDSLSSDSNFPTKVIIKAKDAIIIISIQKKDPIKLCVKLTAKVLTTVYKLKIMKSNFDEDLLQRRIYFLNSTELPEMIFSNYKETWEVLLDYPKIGGADTKDFV